MMKSTISIALVCLALVACADARPKRSVLYAAAPVVAASVPVVHSHVVSQPTHVVKTEQVRSGTGASYSYTSEVKSEPVVHTAAVAAAPVAATHVAHTHHVVPTVGAYYAAPAHYAAAAAYYPTAAHYSYYSPYSYVVGK